MKYTKMGIAYHDQEDIGRFCTLCKSAYYNDWSIQDCDYCILSKILQKQKDYALLLDDLLCESAMTAHVTSWHGKALNKVSEDKKC